MKAERMLAVFSLFISFGVYLATMANTVSFFDSGELISGAATLGISHPPGYPLYALVGYIFSKIPFGNIAFRVNLMSAFFGALAVMTLYRITGIILDKLFTDEAYRVKARLAAFSTSLVFAFSLNHWGQTNMAEVYAMNTFFVAFIILILILWRERVLIRGDETGKGSTRLLYLFAFLFGMGAGDHHTILVVAPVAVFVILVTRWRLIFDASRVSMMLFFFILGFSIYLYMPVRATSELIMNWGDPETLKQFLWMFLRQGYPKSQLSRDWGLFFQQMETINLLYEFTIAGFILAVIGLLRFFLKGWVYAGITAIVILVLSVGIVIYGNPPKENIFLLEAFHTPSYMVFSIWIGAAVTWLLFLLTTLTKKLINNEKTGIYPVVIWLVILVAMPSVLFYSHYKKNDRSRNFISFDYAVNELKSLSSNAILFTWGDSGAFPLWYLQYVERYQPDVLLLHTPHLGSDWYVDEIPQLRFSRVRRIPPNHRSPGMVVEIITRENIGIRRSYIDYSSKYSFPVKDMKFIPHGIVYRHVKKEDKIDISIWDTYVTRGLLSDNIVKDLDIGKAIAIYGFCRYDNGSALLREGRRSEAARQFAEAVKIVPGLKGRVRGALFPGKSRSNP